MLHWPAVVRCGEAVSIPIAISNPSPVTIQYDCEPILLPCAVLRLVHTTGVVNELASYSDVGIGVST